MAKMIWRAVMLAALVAGAGCKKEEAPRADADFYKKTQEALIRAKPGAVIELPEGRFQLDRSLSSTVDGITIRGKGLDKTILSFKGQTQGAEGLLLKGNNLTLEDFAVEDTKGDAIKINGTDGLVIRRVRAEWTGGPKATNGAYGLYPVQCKNVLIEDSVAIGASDAGIYVGQSEHVIIRRNKAMRNVAGIESENTKYADIYENTATHNTGGILVFDLPDLPVQGGKSTRVFNNDIFANDTDNFAPEGNIVATVPTGTGMMVMATDQVEIFNNRFRDNKTVNLVIASYFVSRKPINDKNYDPYPEALYIHDNTFSGGGDSPTGLAVKLLALKLGKPFPDILYDGIVDGKKLTAQGAMPEDLRICIRNNGDADFANADAEHGFEKLSRDLAPHDCSHPSPEPVKLSGVAQ
ncbi:parallel beta-helix domain-containing protein [Hyalangium versicolor]|uniref:parallel beta-helix domain-containing protein n=1 Tax=Hyalangium versicolor TaxID=2861190 RepID=UPI001CC9A573|nr:parallel beta-helix domain-containing protein [Hyalangium versicolor]